MIAFTNKGWRMLFERLKGLTGRERERELWGSWIKVSNFTLTDPFLPGKLKKTSGPFRWGICLSTLSSLVECLGCNDKQRGSNTMHNLLHNLLRIPFAKLTLNSIQVPTKFITQYSCLTCTTKHWNLYRTLCLSLRCGCKNL